MSQASLIIVGSGIKFISHLTVEVKAYIEQSDKVLYLVNDPAMKVWIKQNNLNTESLDDLYVKYPTRIDCYHAITEYILESVRKNQHVCVVLYGHPSVFSKPGLDAVKQARKEGYLAKILPAISAEDCLFADLLIDPGSSGCQSFEATDFIIYKRQFDTSSHLVLWQAEAIGVKDNAAPRNKNGIKLLCAYLNQFYHHDHEVVIYEAAQYPGFEARIDRILLSELPHVYLSRISTLYIAPARKAACDESTLKALNLNSDYSNNIKKESND